MDKYDILLFDADGTLIDFDRAEDCALATTFERYALPYAPGINVLYQEINRAKWKAFERGEITKQYLTDSRFGELFESMSAQGISADYPDGVAFERVYQRNLGRFCFILEEAEAVCRELSRTHALYIITNGVAETQHSRLDDCALSPYVKGIFVSEEVGWQKPRREYFNYVMAHIPGFNASRALVIGDSLSSDIAGANNAAIPCCWYNPHAIAKPDGFKVDYEIRRLRELLAIVSNQQRV